MKYMVLLDSFEEREIRPPELFAAYAALVDRDVPALLGAPATWQARACPACGGRESAPAFERGAFAFRGCSRCRTLFVSPCPAAGALETFREQSEAERFWMERVVAATAASRGRYVSAPRVDWVIDNAQALERGPVAYLHLAPGHDGVPEALAERAVFARVVAASPPPAPPVAAEPGVQRLRTATAAAVRDVPARVDLAGVFELLEGEAAPLALLAAVRERLTPGGRVLITSLSADGFEIQMLGARTRGVGLPSRLNLFSLPGIEALLARAGFRIVELSTPGRLDVQLVADALRASPGLPLPPFVRAIVEHQEPEVHRHFQEFLQLARLSSHLRVVAELDGGREPGDAAERT